MNADTINKIAEYQRLSPMEWTSVSDTIKFCLINDVITEETLYLCISVLSPPMTDESSKEAYFTCFDILVQRTKYPMDIVAARLILQSLIYVPKHLVPLQLKEWVKSCKDNDDITVQLMAKQLHYDT